jgi:hypothetical protein
MARRKGPTASEINAVHRVLYDRKRVKKLANLSNNIQVLMNFNADVQLGPNDPRGPAGSGPQWYIPGTGALDPIVIEGSGYCDQIASTLMEMVHGISQVDIPKADKEHLTAAISSEAALWHARGKVWRAPGNPGNADKAASTISKHMPQILDNVKHVQAYLKPPSEVHL